MEQEEREQTGITRTQHVIHVLPHGWGAVEPVLQPLLERIDTSVPEAQLLVITPDPETASLLSAGVLGAAGTRPVTVVAATGARRVTRLLRERPAHVVLGAPQELLALLKSAMLKLDSVRVLVLAWADDLVAGDAGTELETILAEVPKDAARVLVASQITPAVEELVERYMRRARRMDEGAWADASGPLSMQYVTVAPAARPAVLRRILDELDPPSAAVFAPSSAAALEADQMLRALGYRVESGAVRVVRAGGSASDAALLVLYELPASRQELDSLLGRAPHQVVALVQPRQLPNLRALAGGGALSSLTLPGATTRARSREEALRAEVREVLAGGTPSRELLMLEPLLDEYDGAELAAAALRLLERERERTQTGTLPVRREEPVSEGWTRIFVNVGTRDGARTGDLVGAIAGETGATREQIGKIELRDTHALVEIASAAAPTVVERLTGTSVRGRRVVARIDQDRSGDGGERRPGRSGGGGRGAGERPTRGGGDRASRPAGDRGSRGAGDRPSRPAGDRGPRGAGAPRGPRDATTDPRSRGGSHERPRRSGPRDAERDLSPARDRQRGGEEETGTGRGAGRDE